MTVRPSTVAEIVEVADLMYAVLGAPESMDNPVARAIYLLDQDRIRRGQP